MRVRDEVRSEVVSPPARPWDIDCSRDQVLTKQEFKDDCDINVIIGRCVKSGLPLPHIAGEALYADVSEVGSYTDCVRRVKAAEESFMALPANIRSRFDNQPGALIAFLADESNRKEAIALGLVVAKEPVAPKVDSPPKAEAADKPK